MSVERTGTPAELMDLMPCAVALLRDDEKVLRVNDALLRLYGCRNEAEFAELTGNSFRGMVLPDDYRPLSVMTQEVSQPLVNTGAVPLDYRYISFCIRTKQGRVLHVEGSARLNCCTDGSIWSVLLVDIHTRYMAMERDALTNLLGTHIFFAKVEEIAKADTRAGTFGQKAVIYLNLTNFKRYNASYGIEQGDDCLRRLAALLRKYFPGCPLARMSSDIFVGLVPAADLTSRLAELAEEVDAYLSSDGIRLCAGIRYFGPQERLTANVACDQAKAACESIKKEKKSYAVFTERLREELELRAYVAAHIDEAVKKKYLQVYYQPVVRTLTGRLSGVEALVRWHDPVYGLLTPNQFIPVLEEERLIDKLDAFVVRECGRQLRRRLDEKKPVVPVSFNISRLDFQLTDPFAVVEAVVQEYELPRELLRVELTETAMVSDSENIMHMIERFRSSGYEVWLDDFGSGYSSLNVLKDYHFDELKIDMEFLRVFNDTSRQIITSVVMMAKAIGIHTLAEGVETLEQVEFLRSIGCEKIQGYYYGRPMPYELLLEHCQEQHLCAETGGEERIYEQTGLFNVITTAPVALFSDNGTTLQMIYANDAYQKVMAGLGFYSLEEVNHKLKTLTQYSAKRLRSFADRIIAKRPSTEKLTFFFQGRCLIIRARTLAGNAGFFIHTAAVADVTHSTGNC